MNSITTMQDLKLLCARALDSPILFVDIETTGLDPYTTRLLLISLRFGGETYVVDLVRLPVALLKPVLENPNSLKVFHNAVFDVKHLYHNGIYAMPTACTMINEQLIESGLRVSGFGLDDVAERRLGIHVDKTIRNSFIERDINIPFTQDELEYSAKDVELLEPIFAQQLHELDQENLKPVYDLECELIPITARMEYYGICIDAAKLAEAKPVVLAVIDHATKLLQDEIIRAGVANEILFDVHGYTAANVAGQKQMLEIFQAMGIDVRSLGKKELSDWDAQWAMKHGVTTNGSADIDDIRMDSDTDSDMHVGYHHPFLKQHAIRTAAAKLEGTYITGLLDRINPVTHRIHPGYKQCGAVSTGRYSSVSPKLNWAFGLREPSNNSVNSGKPNH